MNRNFHPAGVEYTLKKLMPGTFTTVDHNAGHKNNLKKQQQQQKKT